MTAAQQPDAQVLVRFRRCRLCGVEDAKVHPGIWRSSKDRYHMVNRCSDHQACEERRAAL